MIEIVPAVRTECHDAPVARRYVAAPDVWLMWCVRCHAPVGSPGPEDIGWLFVEAMEARHG